MTIAAGFLCDDGLVLCADSQYSGAAKISQPKLFGYEFNNEERLIIAFALAGHEIYGKTAIEECVDALSTCSRKELTARKAWRLLRKAVKSVHDEYVGSLTDPVEKDIARFELVIGCYLPYGGGLNLFRTSGPGVLFGERYYAIGSGSYLGDYMIKGVFEPSMHITDVAILAIHAIAAAKSYDAACGGDTQIRVIYPNGGLGVPVEYTNVAYIEGCIKTFEAATRRLLFQLGNVRTAKLSGLAHAAEWSDDSAFDNALETFVEEVRNIRGSWRLESFEALLKLFRRLRAQQVRESPTHDPQSPPPSPESPGGSDGI